MVVVANEKQEGGGRKEEVTNIKSNKSHLAGGESDFFLCSILINYLYLKKIYIIKNILIIEFLGSLL